MINILSKIRGCFNFVTQTLNYNSYSVLIPMAKFIGQYSTKGISYISFPKFAEIKQQVLEEQYQIVQFSGLSGIGKSRLMFEIFKDLDNTNNYYCQNASDERLINELSFFLHENNESGIIVLDNCNADAFSKICSLRLEIDSSYKIIGIYNDPESVVRQSGVNQLFLKRRDLVDSVNQYVSQEIGQVGEQAESIVGQIQMISNGFPAVAIKAILSYKANGVANLMNEDELWKKMCGYQYIDEDKRKALQSLALFDPLGYEQEFASDYKMIKYNKSITPFYDYNKQRIDDIFESLIKSYTQQELVEKNSCWILVRPLPLAVWLVGQWLHSCSQERLVQVFNDIDGIQDIAQANRMKRALCKRIQNMQGNEKAKKLFDMFMADGALFHHEEVVCSDFGSRLFLSISTVNPDAVMNCLYDIIIPKSVVWVKNEIKGDIRRNYIWCLEKLSLPEETFQHAALLLAKLSLAENESWANNATGQLLQLFHVALSGTAASLKQRLEVIRKLLLDAEYTSIVLKIIDSAFCYSHFHRNAGYEHIGGEVLRDFEPTGVDIYEYWTECVNFLSEILHSNPEYVSQVADIVVKHVEDLGWRSGCYDLLEQLINMIVGLRGNKWPEMYKQLLQLKKYDRDKLSEDRKEKINCWLKMFGAGDFLLALEEAHTIFYSDNRNLPFEEKMTHAVEYFTPMARRFQEEELYVDIKVVQELLDSQTNEVAFIRAIAKVLTSQQIKAFLEIILKCLETKNNDYQSAFLNILYFSLPDSDYKENFRKELFLGKKYFQYIILKTNSETESLDVLKEVIELIKKEALSPKLCLRLYLYRIAIDSADKMFEICAYIEKHVDNSNDILLDYIIAHEYSSVILEGKMKALTKRMLLSYDYKNSSVDAYGVNRIVKGILASGEEVGFAVDYNKKLLNIIHDYESFRVNEHVYYSLLPKYQNEVLEDILEEISQKQSDFWYYGGKDLGSGDGFGVGPLFQCNIEIIKDYCLKESQGCLPYRLAYLAPVFDYSEKEENSFSKFFYWLLEHFDNFKEQKYILSEFDSNMNSFSWMGSLIPLLEKKLECLKKLDRNPNPMIKKWVSENIKALSEQLRREQISENYRKLC